MARQSISIRAHKSRSNHRSNEWKLKPAAASTALIRSPFSALEAIAAHAMLGLEVTDHRLTRRGA
jgi:hypothetical protein